MDKLIPFLIEWLKNDTFKKIYVWLLLVATIILVVCSALIYKEKVEYSVVLFQGAGYTLWLCFVIWLLIKLADWSTDLREQADRIEKILTDLEIQYNNSWDSTRIDRSEGIISDRWFAHYIPLTRIKKENYGIWITKENDTLKYYLLYWDKEQEKSRYKEFSISNLTKENFVKWREMIKEWELLEQRYHKEK